jgi:hypothetical protein
LPTKVGGSNALDVLEDDGSQTAVVLELVGAVVDFDAGALAYELVIGAFVNVLKSAPATDVVDKYAIEICTLGLNILDQVL